MKTPSISYRLIIPREKNITPQNIHFANSMEFGCAAYAAQLLSQVSTDFSYTVPSAYKSTPFEYCLEITEPEKFVDVLYKLLCAYNPNFTAQQDDSFHFEASQYFRKVVEEGRMDVAGYGLIAVAWGELELSR